MLVPLYCSHRSQCHLSLKVYLCNTIDDEVDVLTRLMTVDDFLALHKEGHTHVAYKSVHVLCMDPIE